MEKIVISNLKWIEEVLNLVSKLMGLFFAGAIMYYTGQYFSGETPFNTDFLFSVILIPLVAVLKDIPQIFEGMFVTASLKDNSLCIEQGYFTNFIDEIELKNIENVEIRYSVLGRFFDYADVTVAAYGSFVHIPYVKTPDELKNAIKVSKANNKN